MILYQLHKESRMRVFCVANQKGGVGKTTTTVNLAAGLAQIGRRVLVVDLDPQGNATMGSGIDKRALDLSVYDVLLENATIAEARKRVRRPATTSSAPTASSPAPRSSSSASSAATSACAGALAAAADDYDFVLIDCPPSLSLLTLNGLASAHGVVVPMQCEYFALEGLSRPGQHDQAGPRQPQPGARGDRHPARHVRSAHHVAVAGQRAAQGALRRQGLRHRDPAQRAPGRGAELRHAGRGVRPGSKGALAFLDFAREMAARADALQPSRRERRRAAASTIRRAA